VVRQFADSQRGVCSLEACIAYIATNQSTLLASAWCSLSAQEGSYGPLPVPGKRTPGFHPNTMRLIDVKTRQLVEFIGASTPNYAILSHTWEAGEEVTLQEFIGRSALQKRGWAKINKACDLAQTHDLNYVWVDTISIDKTSSAELSEAINSMFEWYRKSYLCYAFLSDWAGDDNFSNGASLCRW
jgi:hypothetical protein